MKRFCWTLVLMGLVYALQRVVGIEAVKAMSTGQYCAFTGIAAALNLAGYIEGTTRR